MKKAVITGATGQLGKVLCRYFQNVFELIPLSRSELDITNLEKTRSMITSIKPDIVIHCAALTDVDKCEKNPNLAYIVNSLGTKNIALSCSECGSEMVYISTNYVFDGNKNEPYNEFDKELPCDIYGKSKYYGEIFVKDLLSRYFIVRTGWLYGSSKKGFIEYVINCIKSDKTINIIDGYIGTPTLCQDLCKPLERIIHDKNYGTYHITNSGSASRTDIAKFIMKIVNKQIPFDVTDSLSRLSAPRPKNSVLKNLMLELYGYPVLRDWHEALEEYIYSVF